MFDNMFSNLNETAKFFICGISIVFGAFCLIKFCGYFVNSASYIAKKFGIPSIVVGLTVVAIGTSVPELAVSVIDAISSIKDGTSANISFSNVVGSNISNLLLVLSFGCFFSGIVIKKETKKEYFIMTVITFLLLMLTLFGGNKEILRLEGLLLILVLISYVTYIVIGNKKNEKKAIEEDIGKEKILKHIFIILLSIAVIAIGGELVVFGAKGIALNVSEILNVERDIAETFIGLTIVAVGTSLPELVTTIIASKKGENEMALGNVIGSNIFNIVFVLGLSSTISPFSIADHMVVDVIVLMFATMVILFFVCKGKFSKKHSVFMISMYLIYLIYIIIRSI